MIIAINNLKYFWQFILENEKIEYDYEIGDNTDLKELIYDKSIDGLNLNNKN